MTSLLPQTSTPFRCPICHALLQRADRHYYCENHHHFDVAKEGYVNLLPVQHKNSKQPGDSKAMLQQRRLFLQSGAYQPLVDDLLNVIDALQPTCLLDSGCGEGYYSRQLRKRLPTTTELHAMDISKAAIQLAAKHGSGIHFCVASAKELPYPAASFDAILLLCAPFQTSELQRVLQDQAALVLVSAAPQHLLEFKQGIYQDVKLHSDAIRAIDGFVHQQRQRCSFELNSLSPESYLSLLNMMPLGWKLTEAQKQVLCARLTTLQADFYIDVYCKGS
ncbi:methyltransferase domain-containing protein [Alkalimonas collagenimarina]|uniref:Methyltransferase domain-containing protein n=1 Tax=Alkalimonas collagenimarina TaxID=400390 RepID=A0ABT9GZY1_9GAMM|nr:methyltransferase domain-containing protein [Alkalimonas collagenimarina]MDP4536613.1 methyltransferase domain-containing protein [Alkalimonas collagenimarina]